MNLLRCQSSLKEQIIVFCPDDEDEDAITTALNLPSLTKEDIETVPLNGHWRYYKLRGETWGTKFNNVW